MGGGVPDIYLHVTDDVLFDFFTSMNQFLFLGEDSIPLTYLTSMVVFFFELLLVLINNF